MVFELLFEGLAIGLMIWRYKQHSQIIAFLLKTSGNSTVGAL